MNHRRLEVCPSLLIGTAGFSWLDRSEGVVLPGRFSSRGVARGKILGAAWPRRLLTCTARCCRVGSSSCEVASTRCHTFLLSKAPSARLAFQAWSFYFLLSTTLTLERAVIAKDWFSPLVSA